MGRWFAGLFWLLVLSVMPAVHGQFTTRPNEDGSVTLTGFACTPGVLTVPSSLEGRPVTAIGRDAFRDCASLTGVILPDGLRTVGESAFWGCSSLTDITLPDTVVEVGDWAFASCPSLTGVTLPKELTSLGTGVFYDCGGLAAITLPQTLTTIGRMAFVDCVSLATMVLPPGLRELGVLAFSGCRSLAAIEVPDAVEEIPDFAFQQCAGLARVTLGTRVRRIGNSAFYGCGSLERLVLPASLGELGDNALAECGALEEVEFLGDAPVFSEEWPPFGGSEAVWVLYPPDRSGWGPFYADRPASPRLPPIVLQLDRSAGGGGGELGVILTGAPDITVVVESADDFGAPEWLRRSTNVLTGGRSVFVDLDWTNSSTRLYRVRLP